MRRRCWGRRLTRGWRIFRSRWTLWMCFGGRKRCRQWRNRRFGLGRRFCGCSWGLRMTGRVRRRGPRDWWWWRMRVCWWSIRGEEVRKLKIEIGKRRINAEFAESAEKRRGTQDHRQECLCHKRGKRELEGEDLEVALAGEHYAEEAAVGGEGVFADGEAVEEHAGLGFEDGDFGARWIGAEFRDLEGDEVGGFFFDGAFQVEACLVRRPMGDSQSYRPAGGTPWRCKIAWFQVFLVWELSPV